MDFVRLVVRCLRPYRGRLVVVALLQVVQVAASLALPRLNADIIDRGIAAGDTTLIVGTGAAMLGCVLVQVLALAGAIVLGVRISMGVGRDLRQTVFARVATFSERELARFGTPSLLTRTTNDVQQVEMLVLTGCSVLATAPLLCIGGAVLAVGTDPTLSWVLLGAIPALLVPLVLLFRRLLPLWTRAQEQYDRMSGIVREQLGGVRVIRAFTRETDEVARYERGNAEVFAIARAQARYDSVLSPAINIIFTVTVVSLMGIGVLRVADGAIEVGALTAFIGYLMQILMSLIMASFFALMFPGALVSAGRVRAVLDTVPSVSAPPVPRTDVVVRGAVEFRDVTFAYPGAEQPVLRGIGFTAEPGRTTAIVGSTGAGKTTLLGLLLRLFDVTGGAVLVDGADVRDLDPEELWARIGYVPQRAHLFAGTVASNLRYGDARATEVDLWSALEVAQAREFVAALPEGLDAAIEQGGANLSGGQRQRIAIARAVIRRPRVYVFDDSFSALDTATDARLRAALGRELGDATVIIVAQRVSTILDADQIVVLDNGEIVGRGRHDELVASCPAYAEIVASQLVDDAA
jgi:ATP-binding cassette subfamily B protein